MGFHKKFSNLILVTPKSSHAKNFTASKEEICHIHRS